MHKDGVYLSPPAIPIIACGGKISPETFFAEITIFPFNF